MRIVAAFLIVAACLIGGRGEALASTGAMIFGSDAISSPCPVTLPTATDSWFTNGDGMTVQGTQAPCYWFDKTGGEIDNFITSSGQTLNMSDFTQMAHAASIIGRGRLIGFGPGTNSWTAPAGVYSVKVTLIGAGGGGGGASGASSVGQGGGGGGYAQAIVAVTPGSTYTITVNGGAMGGGVGAAGNNAGSSSFNGMVTAAGGAGGAGAASGAFGTSGGAGGSSSGATIAFAGGQGASGARTDGGGSTPSYIGGSGGTAGYGVGPGAPFVASNATTSVNGLAGSAPGGGGGGGLDGGGGGTGGNGACILEY